MTNSGAFPGWAIAAARRLVVGATLLLALILQVSSAFAVDKAQLIATQESGFARLILSFPGRLDLPEYELRYDNNVLAIEFSDPISVPLPDISSALPDYATIARTDPDDRGIRVGLRNAVTLNSMEAGEQLYIDLMPAGWQGLPPSLPDAVVAELADRAKRAAEVAEQKRKAAEAEVLQPVATLRVGRNPTFFRIQFNWSADTKASFALDADGAELTFDWPVPVDLYALKSDLPAQIRDVSSSVDANGSQVKFALAEGVVPRFYEQSPTQFVIDIDLVPEEGIAAALKVEEAAAKLAREAAAKAGADTASEGGAGESEDSGAPGVAAAEIVPQASVVGETVRIAFPFDQDTPAAVFRRGDTVWMVFDSPQAIAQPERSDALDSVARQLDIVSSGQTRIVRMDLATDRLATLGSEGRSWVLSLGDVLLGATEPVILSRERGEGGELDMRADLGRPGDVHVLHDPDAGDTLSIVTILPPARGIVRDMKYVDFDALRSAHGLVIRPRNETLAVNIDGSEAVITADGGLTLSDSDAARVFDGGNAAAMRASYLDLQLWREDDPSELALRTNEILARAASGEGRVRDIARLDLATLYVANELSYEALGVLRILSATLSDEDLRKKTRLVEAIAATLAGRHDDAIAVLATGSFPEETDALLWRTMARVDAEDYAGARLDAIAGQQAVAAYPNWVRNRFHLAGIRAAVETRDLKLALDLLKDVDFATLAPEDVSRYQLLRGRVAELEGKPEDALDAYGLVVAAEFRPSRAEAVYRTLVVLDETKRIDLAKATETLAAEAMMWRGNRLESDMRGLLADLYFRNKDYRQGFETVRVAAASFPNSAVTDRLLEDAQLRFEDLFLNGTADALDDLSALSLYYDYRDLTPPGAKGDEMIRNLARRLVRIDLLQQAGDLLEYQVESRLKGVGRAQVAADLAIIRIADRDPESALRVLNATRIPELPPSLERQRRVLEARALIDAGRQDLALDLVSRLSGRDIDLLRIDGYWKSRNFRMAAELLEIIHTPDRNDAPLTRADRSGLLKAAVGFVLASDAMGLSRLRSKFSGPMSNSAEWPMFEYVTRDVEAQSDEFKAIAREVAAIDALDAFLTSYRELYPAHSDVVPDKVSPPSA
jgi:hypothetical protein